MRLAQRFRDFFRCRRGAGAIEFAIVVPVLLVLYIGGAELTMAFTLDRKLKHVATTLADLSSQQRYIRAEELDDMLSIAGRFLQPYDAAPFSITISGIEIDADGNGTVAWTRARHGVESERSFQFDFAELEAPRSSFVVAAEAQYAYHPQGGYGLQNPIKLQTVIYFQPRTGGRVECTNC